jgi:hypothetical protein
MRPDWRRSVARVAREQHDNYFWFVLVCRGQQFDSIIGFAYDFELRIVAKRCFTLSAKSPVCNAKIVRTAPNCSPCSNLSSEQVTCHQSRPITCPNSQEIGLASDHHTAPCSRSH